MKLDKGLEVIDVLNSLGNRNKIYLTLIHDKDNVVLVDTGIPGSLQCIKDHLFNANLKFNQLSKVILTHQDMDHMGGLSSIKEELSNVEIMVHEDDVDYVEGTKTPIKLTDEFMTKLKSMINLHSVKKQQELNKILENYHVKVDKKLSDQEELPICGGIKVIHTPGHTPGHISLYLKKYKTLIAGDALNITNGELYGPDYHQALDYKEAIDSLKKLSDFNIKTVICYHGGVYDKNVNKRIQEIIKDELNELNQKK